MLWSSSGDVVLGSVHCLDKQSFHSFSEIGVINLEQAVLERSAACCIHLVSNLVHAISKGLESPRIGRSLSAKKSFFGKTLCDLLSNISVCFVKQFLDEFMGCSGVKDVLLNRDILIIQLIDQS